VIGPGACNTLYYIAVRQLRPLHFLRAAVQFWSSVSGRAVVVAKPPEFPDSEL